MQNIWSVVDLLRQNPHWQSPVTKLRDNFINFSCWRYIPTTGTNHCIHTEDRKRSNTLVASTVDSSHPATEEMRQTCRCDSFVLGSVEYRVHVVKFYSAYNHKSATATKCRESHHRRTDATTAVPFPDRESAVVSLIPRPSVSLHAHIYKNTVKR
jgi:hypothetical protein